MKPVLVEWEDAQQHDDKPWIFREEAASIEPCLVKQVGYLVEHTRERIALAHAVNSKLQHAARDVIPTGMIRSITELVSGKPLPIKPRRKYAPIPK